MAGLRGSERRATSGRVRVKLTSGAWSCSQVSVVSTLLCEGTLCSVLSQTSRVRSSSIHGKTTHGEPYLEQMANLMDDREDVARRALLSRR